MSGTGSSGRHGGGHKARDRAADTSDRKANERARQARIATQRGHRDRSGRSGKKTT